jgi:alkylhydroperoxidase family enzyme
LKNYGHMRVSASPLGRVAIRLADRPDAVSDEVWEQSARHYDEKQLAAPVIAIAAINAWNRINATTGRSPATG